MQGRAAHAQPGARLERRLDAAVGVHIGDAAKRFAVQSNTESLQLPHGVRHQTLSAGLVDGSAAPVDDDDVEAGPYGVQCGGEPGRAASGDEQVDHFRLARAEFSVLSRVRSSAALQTVKTTAVIHAA